MYRASQSLLQIEPLQADLSPSSLCQGSYSQYLPARSTFSLMYIGFWVLPVVSIILYLLSVFGPHSFYWRTGWFSLNVTQCFADVCMLRSRERVIFIYSKPFSQGKHNGKSWWDLTHCDRSLFGILLDL